MTVDLLSCAPQQAFISAKRLLVLMTKPLEYSLRIKHRGEIVSFLEELSEMGEEVLSKGNYPDPNYTEVYHIGGSTVKVAHNAPGNDIPHHFHLYVYGRPPPKFIKWLKKQKRE